MFSLEMILKLTAFGSFSYLRNPYNVFDGIIVIIRYGIQAVERVRCVPFILNQTDSFNKYIIKHMYEFIQKHNLHILMASRGNSCHSTDKCVIVKLFMRLLSYSFCVVQMHQLYVFGCHSVRQQKGFVTCCVCMELQVTGFAFDLLASVIFFFSPIHLVTSLCL